jgi:hypothetical protein
MSVADKSSSDGVTASSASGPVNVRRHVIGAGLSEQQQGPERPVPFCTYSGSPRPRPVTRPVVEEQVAGAEQAS